MVKQGPEKNENQMSAAEKIRKSQKDWRAKRDLRKRKRARRRAEKSYEKELNEQGRTTRGRQKEHTPHHVWGQRLIIANVIVFVLLIIVIWMVFYV